MPRPMTKNLYYDHADMRLDSLADIPLTELLAKPDGTLMVVN